MTRRAVIPLAICIVLFVAFMFGRPSDGQQLPTKNPSTNKQGTVSILYESPYDEHDKG